MSKWILGAALALSVLPLWGTELVVDGQNPQASDQNPGTADRPLKTVAKAADIVQPGDVVRIKQGLYRETVPLRRSGEPGAPVRFVADPPGGVVITGADPVTAWVRVDGESPIYKVPWTRRFIINHTPEGLPIEHHPENAAVWGRAEQVIVDGRQLVPAGTLAALQKAWTDRPQTPRAADAPWPAIPDPSDPSSFYGMFAVDTTARELYLWLHDGSDPNSHQVEAATRGECFGLSPWANREGVHNVELYGLIFRYAATFPQRAGVWLQGRDNRIENCIIEQMSGSGVSVSGVLRRCVIRGCGHTGGCASGPGFLNEENQWENNCWKLIPRGWDAGGVKMARANGGTFRRCAFLHNGGPGLWFDINVRNVLVTECVFADNEGSGIFIEISRDITVLRNLLLRNGLWPTGRWWSSGGVQIAESMNCVVAHNTCVGNKDGICFREQGPRELASDEFGVIPYHNQGNVVVGNICASNRGYQLGLWYDNGFFGWHPADQAKYKDIAGWLEAVRASGRPFYDPTQVGTIIDRNLYWAEGDQKLVLYGCEWRPKHQVFGELKDFTAATGFDAHSQVADPGFTDLAAGDFTPRREGTAWRQQVGWLTPPADVTQWLNSFLPPFR